MQSKVFGIRHQEGRVHKGVPLVDGGEDSDGGQDWRNQRYHNAGEAAQITRPIHGCRFLQGRRNGFDEGFDQNDVKGRNNRRQNVSQIIIGQVQIVHGDVPGNEPGAEVHGNNDEPVPDAPSPHFIFGEEVPEKGG
ncbi:hypothetical protein D3C76_1389340 [compost metagenome]